MTKRKRAAMEAANAQNAITASPQASSLVAPPANTPASSGATMSNSTPRFLPLRNRTLLKFQPAPDSTDYLGQQIASVNHHVRTVKNVTIPDQLPFLTNFRHADGVELPLQSQTFGGPGSADTVAVADYTAHGHLDGFTTDSTAPGLYFRGPATLRHPNEDDIATMSMTEAELQDILHEAIQRRDLPLQAEHSSEPEPDFEFGHIDNVDFDNEQIAELMSQFIDFD